MPDRPMDPMDPVRSPVGNRLRNGGRGGDPATAPRCAARSRAGQPCRRPAMRGRKRCNLHGGRSRGPTTAEGRERCRQARWKHGARGAEMLELLRQARDLRDRAKAWVKAMEGRT